MLQRKAFRLQKPERMQACKLALLAKAHYSQDDVQRGLDVDVQELYANCKGKLRIQVNPKILIVMKSLIHGCAMGVVLKNNGCQVVVCTNGFDAYTKYLRHRSKEFSLVLCEWYMSGIAGRDLAFYESQSNGTLPFVALLKGEESAADAIRSGADLFLRMPLLAHLTYILELCVPNEMTARLDALNKMDGHYVEVKSMLEHVLDTVDHNATDEKELVEMVRSDFADSRDIASLETGTQLLDNVIRGMRAMQHIGSGGGDGADGADGTSSATGESVDAAAYKKACKALRGIVQVFNDMKKDILNLQEQSRLKDVQLRAARDQQQLQQQQVAAVPSGATFSPIAVPLPPPVATMVPDAEYAALKNKADVDKYVHQLQKKLAETNEVNEQLQEHLERIDLYRVEVEEEIMSNGLVFNFQEFNVIRQVETRPHDHVVAPGAPAGSSASKALSALKSLRLEQSSPNLNRSTSDIIDEMPFSPNSPGSPRDRGINRLRSVVALQKSVRGMAGALAEKQPQQRSSIINRLGGGTVPRNSFIATQMRVSVRDAIEAISRRYELAAMMKEDVKKPPMVISRLSALARPPEHIIKDATLPLDVFHNTIVTLMTAVAAEVNSFAARTAGRFPALHHSLQELVNVLTLAYSKVKLRQLVASCSTGQVETQAAEVAKVRHFFEQQLAEIESSRTSGNNNIVQNAISTKMRFNELRANVASFSENLTLDMRMQRFYYKWLIWQQARKLKKIARHYAAQASKVEGSEARKAAIAKSLEASTPVSPASQNGKDGKDMAGSRRQSMSSVSASKEEELVNLRVSLEEEKEQHRQTTKFLVEARQVGKRKAAELEILTKELMNTKSQITEQAQLITSLDEEVSANRKIVLQLRTYKEQFERMREEHREAKMELDSIQMRTTQERMDMLVKQSESLKIKWVPKDVAEVQAVVEQKDVTTQSLPVPPDAQFCPVCGSDPSLATKAIQVSKGTTGGKVEAKTTDFSVAAGVKQAAAAAATSRRSTMPAGGVLSTNQKANNPPERASGLATGPKHPSMRNMQPLKKTSIFPEGASTATPATDVMETMTPQSVLSAPIPFPEHFEVVDIGGTPSELHGVKSPFEGAEPPPRTVESRGSEATSSRLGRRPSLLKIVEPDRAEAPSSAMVSIANNDPEPVAEERPKNSGGQTHRPTPDGEGGDAGTLSDGSVMSAGVDLAEVAIGDFDVRDELCVAERIVKPPVEEKGTQCDPPPPEHDRKVLQQVQQRRQTVTLQRPAKTIPLGAAPVGPVTQAAAIPTPSAAPITQTIASEAPVPSQTSAAVTPKAPSRDSRGSSTSSDEVMKLLRRQVSRHASQFLALQQHHSNVALALKRVEESSSFGDDASVESSRAALASALLAQKAVLLGNSSDEYHNVADSKKEKSMPDQLTSSSSDAMKVGEDALLFPDDGETAETLRTRVNEAVTLFVKAKRNFLTLSTSLQQLRAATTSEVAESKLEQFKEALVAQQQLLQKSVPPARAPAPAPAPAPVPVEVPPPIPQSQPQNHSQVALEKSSPTENHSSFAAATCGTEVKKEAVKPPSPSAKASSSVEEPMAVKASSSGQVADDLHQSQDLADVSVTEDAPATINPQLKLVKDEVPRDPVNEFAPDPPLETTPAAAILTPSPPQGLAAPAPCPDLAAELSEKHAKEVSRLRILLDDLTDRLHEAQSELAALRRQKIVATSGDDGQDHPAPPKAAKPPYGVSPRADLAQHQALSAAAAAAVDGSGHDDPNSLLIGHLVPQRPSAVSGQATGNRRGPGPGIDSAALDGLVRELNKELGGGTSDAYKKAVRDTKHIKAANLDRHNHATIATMLMMSHLKHQDSKLGGK